MWQGSLQLVVIATAARCSTALRKSYDWFAVVLFSLVATHADIDLETVAQLSNGSSELASTALTGSPVVSGAVVLATCNRYEIYGETANGADVEAARSARFPRSANSVDSMSNSCRVPSTPMQVRT
jgi:glutamyl-tRNA reductase